MSRALRYSAIGGTTDMNAITRAERLEPIMRFTIYHYSSDALAVAWTGTPDADDAPIAFRADMLEYGPRMAVGDTLILNEWHWAERVA